MASPCCWAYARYKPGHLHYPAFRAVRDMASAAEERPELLSAAANEVARAQRELSTSLAMTAAEPALEDEQWPQHRGEVPERVEGAGERPDRPPPEANYEAIREMIGGHRSRQGAAASKAADARRTVSSPR
jgi:hypothetical protein